MTTGLPRSTPADQLLDPAAVLAFVEAVEADPEVELHSLMVLRHGHVVAEGWWAPHAPERTRLLYSLSKSFTSAALGLALQEGLLDLDDPVVSHFPEFDADVTDPRSRAITLRHAAAMAAGHDRDLRAEALARDPQDPVRGFLLVPPDADPGTLFAYSQPCTYAVASAVQRAAGMRLTEYLRPRLFDPLGIGEVGWSTWPPGREQGFSGLFARTEDVAKLGQLHLQRGRWGDTQLLPESWVEQATSRQVDTPEAGDVDWRQGYGFQFWRSRHGYRGDGAFGQFCVVLPEQDAVVATTGGTEAMQAVLDALWEHLLPGFDRPDERPDADHDAQRALDERLRGLALSPCPARPLPPDGRQWTGTFPVVPPAEDLPAAPLDSVGLRITDAGLEVTLTEPADALTLPVGDGAWTVSEPRDRAGHVVPVATSGGLDDETVRVEVLFLETPHRMDVECSLPARTAVATWRHAPLTGGRLETLHRPR